MTIPYAPLARRIAALVLAVATVMLPGQVMASPMAVCATVPGLGGLSREIGGDRVSVTVFAKATEDPHFAPARPSYVKALSKCAALVLKGLDLEVGWLPVLLRSSRNLQVQPGQRGYIDASVVIRPLEIPQLTITRAMGDVHPFGNPHYLVDPLNGVLVARLLRNRFSDLLPADRAYFNERLAAFEQRMFTGLVGPSLAATYGADVEKLARLHEQNKLVPFLESQGQADQLGGWLGAIAPHFGTRYVDDHRMWRYFSTRFGLVYTTSLEPVPGIAPSTKHLQHVVEMIGVEKVPVVLTSAYYDPRHARFIAKNTSAKVLRMANQMSARPDTDDYFAMSDYNVRQVVDALASSRP